MTAGEKKVYEFLKANGSVGRQDLYRHLYPEGVYHPEPKIIDVLICKVRKKLPEGEQIVTVWGHGYEWSLNQTAQGPILS